LGTRPREPFPGTRARWSIERIYVIARTAFVSTYPPRQCGIATFTHHLAAAMGEREIVVLLPWERGIPYPLEVHHRIRRDERGDYAQAARAVAGCVDVVSIQHAYGIWGGDDGEYVLDFVRALDAPAVATLHSILPTPTQRQRAILTELIASVSATVVMSKSAAKLLTRAYGVPARRVEIIPHGVPDLPLADPVAIKSGLGLDGRQVILSFGLIGPDKGYELAIDALPSVAAAYPGVQYVIVGVTHPDLVARDGESYRASLVARVQSLGMADHVQFVDRFVGRVELTRWLHAADVVVTPSPNLDKTHSGPLSYAMGAGRAVVSTPYAYATESLAGGRGVLVPAGSPAGLATALNELLGDVNLREAIGGKAYDYTRRMVWSSTGADYRRVFDRVGATGPLAALEPRLGRAALNA
jgi:glycosyltransferase involved in cell wall biosynthesis